MSVSRRPYAEEVEHLLRNAQLRDELEPLCDESLVSVNVHHLPTPVENEFLASMLAWERAPILPIGQWFNPPLVPPHPDLLADTQIHEMLPDLVDKLFSKRIVLDFTDHLSDRQLYCMIYRDILPAEEKKIEVSDHYLHWDCARTHDDPDIWLRYYAHDQDRETWAEETGELLPPKQLPPYCRNFPQAPL